MFLISPICFICFICFICSTYSTCSIYSATAQLRTNSALPFFLLLFFLIKMRDVSRETSRIQ